MNRVCLGLKEVGAVWGSGAERQEVAPQQLTTITCSTLQRTITVTMDTIRGRLLRFIILQCRTLEHKT
jgi:hypothetical protein